MHCPDVARSVRIGRPSGGKTAAGFRGELLIYVHAEIFIAIFTQLFFKAIFVNVLILVVAILR